MGLPLPWGEAGIAMRRPYRAVTVLAVAAAALTVTAIASATPAAGQPGQATRAGQVTLYSARVLSDRRTIAAGPDGALWYANYADNSIGRITASGNVKSAFHAASIKRPLGIV